jgi:hypothetical protein
MAALSDAGIVPAGAPDQAASEWLTAHELRRDAAAARLDEAARTLAALDEALELFATTEARARVLELALAERASDDAGAASAADAAAVRAQIEAVQCSLTRAERERSEVLGAAAARLDEARREEAAIRRRLVEAVGRVEPGAGDPEGVLARLRERRAVVARRSGTGPGTAARVARLAGTPEPLLVLVDVFDPAPDDLVRALVETSGLKTVVYVTENTRVVREAQALPGRVAAVSDLTGGDRPGHVSARDDGEPT